MRTFFAASFITTIALLVCACSDSGSNPIDEGFGVLTGAYASDVKPADAKYTLCKYAQLDGRHVARCEVSYGGTETTQRGYWEVTAQSDSYTIYAMNGKALTALDKINATTSLTSKAYPGVFKSGHGRPPLDVAKVDQAIK